MPFNNHKSTVIFLPHAVAAQFGKNPSKIVSEQLNEKLQNTSYEDLGQIVKPIVVPPPTPPKDRIVDQLPQQEVVQKLRNLQVQIRKDQLLRIRKLTGDRVSLGEALQRIAEHYLVDRED